MIELISTIEGIENNSHRVFLDNFESDLLRGLGKLCVLKVIEKAGDDDGIYGYQIFQNLKRMTDDMLIIKEGTLYPLLRNLEKWESQGVKLSLLESERKGKRKYYSLTEDGKKILSLLGGYFIKLLEAVSDLNDFKINLREEKYIFCSNCSNRIVVDTEIQFCDICGHSLEENNKKE